MRNCWRLNEMVFKVLQIFCMLERNRIGRLCRKQGGGGWNLSPVSFLHCKNAACWLDKHSLSDASVVLMQRMLDLISWVLRHCSRNVLVITLLFTSHRPGFKSAYRRWTVPFHEPNRNVMTAMPTWLQSALDLSGFGAHLLSIVPQHFYNSHAAGVHF